MVIFLHGEDNYRSREKLKEIVSAYKQKNPSQLSFQTIQGKDLDLDRVRNFLETQSMFSEVKLLVVTDVYNAKKNIKRRLLDLFEKLGVFKSKHEVVVVYESCAPDKRTKFYKTLTKKGKAQEFQHLKGRGLKDWIKNKVKKRGLNIGPQACKTLMEAVGSNLWQMEQEVDKLASYVLAQGGKEIKPKHVSQCVTPGIETDIFKTIDVLGQRNQKKALALLKKHLVKGESELKILGMFVFQFRNLLRIKDLLQRGTPYGKLKEKTGLHPFVVKKSASLSKNFTLPELKRIFEKLFELDLGIKTGKIKNPSYALEKFVVDVSEPDRK